MRSALLVVGLAWMSGCQCGSTGPDAGCETGCDDAGGIDAGRRDAGGSDAGTSDAGTSDAGTTDAGTPDAGGPLPVFDGGACSNPVTWGHTSLASFGWMTWLEPIWDSGHEWIFWYAIEGNTGQVDALGEPILSTLSQITPGNNAQSIYLRAARGSSSWGVVYGDDRLGFNQRGLYFAQVNLTGAPIAGSERALASSLDSTLGIAWNDVDSQWGITFGNNALTFERIDVTGGVILGSQRTLPTDAVGSRTGYGRSLIFTGGVWVLAWPTPEGALMLQEIDHTGELIDASLTNVASITNGEVMFDPSVARDPGSGQYGVAWQDNRNTVDHAEVRFARVHSGGGLVAGSELVLSDGGINGSPDLVWDGTQFFVALTRQLPGDQQQIAITGVDPAGQLTIPLQTITCSTGAGDFFPRVNWNGALHSIGYSHQAPDFTEGRLFLIP